MRASPADGLKGDSGETETGADERSSSVRRHARLPGWLLVPGVLLLAASFVSGVLLWRAQVAGAAADDLAPVTASSSVQLWLKLHGAINPLLCVFLGTLIPRHIRAGWKSRANRLSGVAMLLVLAGLAGTGAALYYVGDEAARSSLIWTHRALGLALPLTLAAHWIEAWRWARRL